MQDFVHQQYHPKPFILNPKPEALALYKASMRKLGAKPEFFPRPPALAAARRSGFPKPKTC